MKNIQPGSIGNSTGPVARAIRKGRIAPVGTTTTPAHQLLNQIFGAPTVAPESKKKKPTKVVRNFKFCKSLMFMIQSKTGEKTHDIITNLVTLADDMIEAHELDPADKKTWNLARWSHAKNIKKYMYYPNTKIYMGAYVVLCENGSWQASSVSRDANVIKYSFKLPQSYIKLDDKGFEDMMVEGMLMDFSLNVDEPSIKSTKTPKEKRDEKEKRAAIVEANRKARAAKRAAKKKTKKTTRKSP